MKFGGRTGPDLLPWGTHHVVVKKMAKKRNSLNQVILDDDGVYKAMRVTFQEVNGERVWYEDFYMNIKSAWRMEDFCNAAGVPMMGDEGPDVEEIVGKKTLYISLVCERYQDDNGQVVCKADHTPYFKTILYKFHIDAGIKPAMMGDPTIPDGFYLRHSAWEKSWFSKQIAQGKQPF